MEAKLLTKEALALTEKKMDMAGKWSEFGMEGLNSYRAEKIEDEIQPKKRLRTMIEKELKVDPWVKALHEECKIKSETEVPNGSATT